MGKLQAMSAAGKIPFDLVIKNVRIVNVFTESVEIGDIAITGDSFSYVGAIDFPYTAKKEIDGDGSFAIPGLIDSHMHIESSMMTPDNFARTILPMGTTSIAPDPHEIGNAAGIDGIRAFAMAAQNTPLTVRMAAPSTIPSAPGKERSSYRVGKEEMEKLIRLPGISGLGEVMDYYGVGNAEEAILDVVEAAASRDVFLDGHLYSMSEREVQTFKATGIDANHTAADVAFTKRLLSLGFTVQIQRGGLSKELIEFVRDFPVQNRICLVTDDVSFGNLMHLGHLNGVLTAAIQLGLPAVKAIRYATINAADRLRLYDRGAICPGRKADLCLLNDLSTMEIASVYKNGVLAAENGVCLLPPSPSVFPDSLYHSVSVPRLSAEDFVLRVDDGRSNVTANVIVSDRNTALTSRDTMVLPVKDGIVDTTGLVRMSVIYRYGKKEEALPFVTGLFSNLPGFDGAIATTYAHDCHNLMIYGTDETDMALAANTVISSGGGLCAVKNGKVLSHIALPIAGLMCEKSSEELRPLFDVFLNAVSAIGLCHAHPMEFITLMALAVVPTFKCTDLGLLDTIHGELVPLFSEQ